MNASFAHFCCYLYLLIALVLPIQASAQQVTAPELVAAQQAVAQADQADADHYAPDLMMSARQLLGRAQAAALNRGERKQVPELALRASVDADLARARSVEAVATAEMQQRRNEVVQLQQQLGSGGERVR